MKKLIQTLVLSTALAGAAATYAGDGHGDGHGKGDHHGGRSYMHHLVTKLDLTEEQKKAIEEIHAAYPRGDAKAHKRQFARDISELDPAAPDYQAQVAAIAKEQAAKLEQAIIERGEVHAKVYAVLTPEQRTKLQELKNKRREKLKDTE
jgi:periplasmic protein CpxP/Spy